MTHPLQIPFAGLGKRSSHYNFCRGLQLSEGWQMAAEKAASSLFMLQTLRQPGKQSLSSQKLKFLNNPNYFF
jgi:hypothetical protein